MKRTCDKSYVPPTSACTSFFINATLAATSLSKSRIWCFFSINFTPICIPFFFYIGNPILQLEKHRTSIALKHVKIDMCNHLTKEKSNFHKSRKSKNNLPYQKSIFSKLVVIEQIKIAYIHTWGHKLPSKQILQHVRFCEINQFHKAPP